MFESPPLRGTLGNPSSQFNGHEASAFERAVGSHFLAAALVVVTSTAFLVPAGLAWRSSRYWHAWLFTSMSMICAVYHFCDTGMPLLLGSHETCGVGVLHMLTLLDHGWIYFCMLSVTFMCVGPEDPYLQWADPGAGDSSHATESTRWPPIEVILGSRLVPSAALLLFLVCYPSWRDFHCHCILLCTLMLMVGSLSFWGQARRRNWGTEVLLRKNFWVRLYHLCCCPLLCFSTLLVFQEVTHSAYIHALFHVLIASFAVTVMQSVSNPGRNPAHQVMEQSARNPFVAHQLLYSVAACSVPTFLLSLGGDWYASDTWRWPTLAMAYTSRPGSYILMLGSLPTFVAMLTTFWLISCTLTHPYADGAGDTWKTWWSVRLAESKIDQAWPDASGLKDPLQWAHFSKQFGCNVGYCSVALGVFVAVLGESSETPGLNLLHTVASILFFFAISVSVFFTTRSAPWGLPGSPLRYIMAWALILLIVGLCVLFILVNVRGLDSLHPAYAVTQYLIFFLYAMWPASWMEEVQQSWVQRTAERFEWPVTPWRFSAALGEDPVKK